MTVKTLANKLNAKELNLADPNREVERIYAGDLLSHVMGNAPSNCVWFTVMTNVNICAVATLTDCSVIVVCEGCIPDQLTLERAKTQGINILSTVLTISEAIVRVHNAG